MHGALRTRRPRLAQAGRSQGMALGPPGQEPAGQVVAVGSSARGTSSNQMAKKVAPRGAKVSAREEVVVLPITSEGREGGRLGGRRVFEHVPRAADQRGGAGPGAG